MTRMSREFSLVLLGAGVLTAGYFLWPEQDYQKEADKQAARRVGANGNVNGTRSGGAVLIWVHSSGGSYSATGGRSAAMASVSRGGFGAIGGRVSGGGGG
jgi:hypothetical protein